MFFVSFTVHRVLDGSAAKFGESLLSVPWGESKNCSCNITAWRE